MNKNKTVNSHYSNLVIIYAATILVSALLLFLVQPMIAKIILPLLGGAPSVWNVCMVFFQGMLLTGYFYAHFSIKYLGLKKQSVIHILLLLISLISLPIGVYSTSNISPGNEAIWLLILLIGIIGFPFFFLSANAPMLQKWFAHTKHPSSENPYFLYAISNIGSMVALLGYPFIIEPLFTLQEQTAYWSYAYILLMGLITLCVIYMYKHFKDNNDETHHNKKSKALSWKNRVQWSILAFIPSSLFIGATTHITTDIAAFPLLWVLPLAIYLFTFIIGFSKKAYLNIHTVSFIGLASTLVILFSSIIINIFLEFVMISILVILIQVFSISYCCHRRLANNAPHTNHLTEYYLWISFGGMLGGIFNAFIAPNIFIASTEYLLVSIIAIAILPIIKKQISVKKFNKYIAVGIISFISLLILKEHISEELFLKSLYTLIPVIIILLISRTKTRLATIAVSSLIIIIFHGVLQENQLFKGRSFFGIYKVEKIAEQNVYTFMHGTTLHGAQYINDNDRLKTATYYNTKGPVGNVMNYVNNLAYNNIGIIGLGVGAISCLFNNKQHITFYEIDKMVEDIASNTDYFTYLNDCPPSNNVIIGDARIKIQEATNSSYDIIILDAFSSDAIPIHLITKEAIEIYLNKLSANGLLIMHITNRYLELRPVVAAIAENLNLYGVVQYDQPRVRDISRTRSKWVVLSRNDNHINMIKKNNNDWENINKFNNNMKLWTDDYSNILEVFN
jgi:spermidine synthase